LRTELLIIETITSQAYSTISFPSEFIISSFEFVNPLTRLHFPLILTYLLDQFWGGRSKSQNPEIGEEKIETWILEQINVVRKKPQVYKNMAELENLHTVEET
jgi:hypothetical protein